MSTAAICTREEFLASSFDFIVVGGGTAGCVLASRLTEDPNVSVGVIEAGKLRIGDSNVESMGGNAVMVNNDEYDWRFASTPQSGNHDKVHHVARGKMLGGSSGINFMAYSRPSAEDIDVWSSDLGLDGWSFEKLRPYFVKSQNREGQDFNADELGRQPAAEGCHGESGPIHTTSGPWHFPVEKKLLVALDEACGNPNPADPWGRSYQGFYRSLFTIDRTGNPKRSYAGNGYLAPVLHRLNLKVLTGAVATKVLLSTDDLTAKGVEFKHDGATYQVSTGKELILSCSSIKTPHILELSGIGDPDMLRAAGIDCLVPLSGVGNNLQEQPFSSVVYEMVDEEISFDSLFQRPGLFQEHQALLEENTGMLSGSLSLAGYVPYSQTVSRADLDKTVDSIKTTLPSGDSPLQRKQATLIADRLSSAASPSMQIMGFPAAIDPDSGSADLSRFIARPVPGRNACYSFMICLNYPLSRGSVHAQSSDPMAHPLVDLGFLTHSADADVLAAGTAFVDRVMSSAGLKGSIKQRVEPPPEIDLQDLERGREHVCAKVMSYNHILGSCAMGQVVDEKFQVKGVRRLRVVDVSVVPMQVRGGVMSTAYALAEIASDIIKGHYRA